MSVIRAGINNILVGMANREDPDQTALLDCLSRPFWQATSVQNFRTFTIYEHALVELDLFSLV